MQFVHQALAIGFLLTLIPLLIHLINMLRHRRVKWAAMEFLLKSYKKHRKWVWLKQFLLLLMRMAAVALIVAMLAQWISHGQWLDLIGGRSTHYYVLLDDSASMADRAGDASAFDRALRVLQRLGLTAADRDMRQKFTVLRFTQAAAAVAEGDGAKHVAGIADLNAQMVDANFPATIEDLRNALSVTELSVGPRPAFELLRQLVDRTEDENKQVYVLSDFRNKDWENPTEVKDALQIVERAGAEVHLVQCVASERPNLAVLDVQPADETRAAGVPLFVNVKLKNFSREAARKVQLKIRSVYHDPDTQREASPGNPTGESVEQTVVVDEILPGETAVERMQVYFPRPGRHVVEAILPEDAIASDNRRWCVIDFPEGEHVLVIDGSVRSEHAFYLTSVFEPGQRANTGVRPEVKPTAFLRDASLESLQAFSAIYLLDVGRLDDKTIEVLESYVKAGGGVAFFAGDTVNARFYTEKLHRGGEGLFPLPLVGDELLPPTEGAEKSPDLDVADHPVFNAFLGQRNSFIRLVNVEKFLTPPADWKPDSNSTVKVAARLRNGKPLVVERTLGDGRVVAFLTTLAPQWNNWAGDPTFVVVALKLQSYLATSRRVDDSRAIGVPLDVQIERDKYLDKLAFVSPADNPTGRLVIERPLKQEGEKASLASAALGRPHEGSTGRGETNRSGVYEAWLSPTKGGGPEVLRWALNVDTAEGDLALTPNTALLDKLSPASPRLASAEQFEFEETAQAGFNRSLLLMCLLVTLLLGEQFLAYVASYHPTPIARPVAARR